MHHTVRLAAIAAAFLALGAQAQVYVEGSYVPTKMTGDPDLSSAPKPHVFTGIIGYGLHPNLAVEGLLGLGLKKDTVNEIGTLYQVDFKIQSMYGVYLKPRYQVTDAFELFARLGYVKTKFKVNAPADSVYISGSSTEGSTAWGLGGNYAFDKNTYLTLGYNQFFKEDGLKIKGLNLGIGYRF